MKHVLVTQLSGDFPGPVLAQVSVPFYSRDRQQVLIPRGARLVGTAQQVTTRDQGRLSVGFHRLIFPRRPMGRPQFSRSQSAGRNRPQGSNQPPLSLAVCRYRSRRRFGRPDASRRRPLSRRAGGLPVRSRPGARARRYAHTGPLLEQASYHNHPGGPPPPDLVHIRCLATTSTKQTRRPQGGETSGLWEKNNGK